MTSMIIPVFTGTLQSTPVQLCNARDLHAFLAVGKDFSTWIKDRIEQYELIEGEDYLVLKIGEQVPHQGGLRTVEKIDYHLPIDTAKELAMIENNPQGRKVRRYFIAMEKQLRDRYIPLTGLLSKVEPGTKEYRALLKEAHITFYATIQECAEINHMDMVTAWKTAGDITQDIYGINLLSSLGNPHLTTAVATMDKTTGKPKRVKEREPLLSWAQRTALRHAMTDLAQSCRAAFSAEYMAYDWLIEAMNVIAEERIPASRYMEALNLVRVKKAECLNTEKLHHQLQQARHAALAASEAA